MLTVLPLLLITLGVPGPAIAETGRMTGSTFDAIAVEALASKRTAGFSFAVVRDGKIVYAKGFGAADIARKRDVTADTQFAIGSITKQFTASAILLLAQRGQLSLDDSLATFLPAFPNAHSITLRMLLDQTSGLHNSPNLLEHDWPTTGSIDVQKLVAILATDTPDFAPGTKWAYSNTNYTLLQAVIEEVSGTSEAAFLDRNIFAVTNMKSSGFGFAYASQHTAATPYTGEGDALAIAPPISLDLFGGAGAMVATAPDLAAWDIALMHGSILDVDRMHELWTAGTLPDGTSIHYAMGFVPDTLAGHRELWHNGLSPGAGGYCYNAIFPDDRLAVVVLSNGQNFTDVPERMVLRVLAAYDAGVVVPDPVVSVSDSTPVDAAIMTRAMDFFHRLKTNTVDRAHLTIAFAAALTPDVLARIPQELAASPDPTGWTYLNARSGPGATIYTYHITLQGTVREFSFALTPAGAIAGSHIR